MTDTRIQPPEPAVSAWQAVQDAHDEFCRAMAAEAADLHNGTAKPEAIQGRRKAVAAASGALADAQAKLSACFAGDLLVEGMLASVFATQQTVAHYQDDGEARNALAGAKQRLCAETGLIA
jgi:hypothetical protein